MSNKQAYSAADEQALMANLWSPTIVDSPYNFVMFNFPWGVKGTPLEHFKGPRKWQVKVLRKIEFHIREGKAINLPKLLRLARASGRGIGKSALVAWLVLWFMTTRIGGSVVISANTEDQLRKITWAELGKWVTLSLNAHWWDVVGITLRPAKWLSELVEQQLGKGTAYWTADGKLWSEENPDAYAGAHNHDGMMVIFDEASGIPDKIWSVAQGFFTEPTFNRFWFAFSQGRRNTGYFYEIFGKKRNLWDGEQIDARTVEGTDPATYQDIIDEYGVDSDEAMVEVYGMFPSSDNILFISPSLVKKAVDRQVIVDKTAPLMMGIDPSGTGTDNFAIVLRRGYIVEKIMRFKIDDSEIGTMEGVGHIIDALELYDPDLAAMDTGGLGGPMYDRLREQGYKVKPVNFAWKSKNPKRWKNKRAEIWGEMRNWLSKGQLPDDKFLLNDLVGPKKKPDSNGVMGLEAKKDMKSRGLASPDTADALALTFAFTVAKREYNGRVGMGASARRVDAPVASSVSWMGN